MKLDDLKDFVKKNIPCDYPYISVSTGNAKGITIYNVYFNTRLPGSKISSSTIESQTSVYSLSKSSSSVKECSFSQPILLEEFSRTIKESCIINFIDLAGMHLSRAEY